MDEFEYLCTCLDRIFVSVLGSSVGISGRYTFLPMGQ